jgi:putative transposase
LTRAGAPPGAPVVPLRPVFTELAMAAHAQLQLPPPDDARGALLELVQSQLESAPAEPTAYFVTVASLFRRPVFLDPDAARAVARISASASAWSGARCLAWVLMPDRWQGLVVAAPDAPIDATMRRFKAISARAVDDRFRVNGWLWTRGFHQRELDRREDRLAVARHLVANPVRAGLARSVGAWPYWDAVWLSHEAPAPR